MRLLASELLKVRTAPRTVVGLLLGELAIVAIGTASTIDSAKSGPFGLSASLEQDLIGVVASSLLFALILGILVVTWEYRHGTITQTFLATPVRERVLGAKLVVAAVAGAFLVVPALLLMLVIAEIWVGGDEGFGFGADDLRLVARLFLTVALVGILGAEIGAATGRQLGSIIGSFAWIVFAEPAIGIWHSVRDDLPIRALSGVFGADTSTPAFGRSLLVSCAYVVVFGAIALFMTRRRDIT